MAKWKKRYGYRADDDERLICRRALLRTLANGPSPMETLIACAFKKCGFDREDMLEAARYWNVIEEDRDGVIWWRKPDVLALLPKWDYSRRSVMLRATA